MKERKLSEGSAFARPENMSARLKNRGLQDVNFRRLIKANIISCLVTFAILSED